MENIENFNLDPTLIHNIYTRVSRFYPGLSEKTVKEIIIKYIIFFYNEEGKVPTTTEAFIALSMGKGRGKEHLSSFRNNPDKEGALVPSSRRPATPNKRRADKQLRGLIPKRFEES